MNNENKKKIQSAVVALGDELKGKLFPSEAHPERNSYAHIWHTIKEKMGKSYKDCNDNQVNKILKIVEELKRS